MSSTLQSTELPVPASATCGVATPQLPAFKAFGIQVIATGMAILAALSWTQLGFPGLPLILWAATQGLIAAAVAYRAAMDRWWLAIHLLFVPALVTVSVAGLPSWAFLGGFFLLYAFHGATYRTQVPTHLSRKRALEVVAGQLPHHSGFRFIDLGCGFGGVMGTLARSRQDGRYCGVEAALLPYAISWVRGRINGCVTRLGNIWDVELHDYDVVYAYLSPAAMPRLWEKARSEMRPGALLISNSFVVPGVTPTSSFRTGEREDDVVHLWIIGDAEC